GLLLHADDENEVAEDDGDGHPEGGIGVGGVERADMETEQPLDLELLHRAMHVVPTPSQGRRSPSPLAAWSEKTRMARHALLTPAANPTIRPPISAYGVQSNQRSSQ